MFYGAAVRPDAYERAKIRFQSAIEPDHDLSERDTFAEYKDSNKVIDQQSLSANSTGHSNILANIGAWQSLHNKAGAR